ncbi:hypothetical protein TPAR_05955 [Tolypocladium paradoxum]|uniref:Uncharacterized protein n=1 Tax=Tolypocladium paradoxum TaxID=94208 RepID=A0A2S4KUH5_9HYPO|nr:hypothetical protein TPAR_05955 [Tolypocladium paradoxum]
MACGVVVQTSMGVGTDRHFRIFECIYFALRGVVPRCHRNVAAGSSKIRCRSLCNPTSRKRPLNAASPRLLPRSTTSRRGHSPAQGVCGGDWLFFSLLLLCVVPTCILSAGSHM